MMTILLEINRLAREYNGRCIFKDLNLQVAAGEKIGLIGGNGAGKSTLLKIIAGREKPTEGVVKLHLPPEQVGYLPQELRIPEGLTVGALATRWPPGVSEPGETSVFKLLSELGFTRSDYNKPVAALSGGERSRLCLGCVLGRSSRLLLLDEPANHLDNQGLAWLEQHLREYSGAVLIVSHDRYLLDQTVGRILELDRGLLRSFPGCYSDFARIKEVENRARWNAYHEYQRQRKKILSAVNRKKQWARQAAAASSSRTPYLAARAKRADRVVKSLQRRLERLEAQAPEKPWEHRRLRLELPAGAKTGTRIIHAEELGYAFGDKVLWENASFTIFAGEAAVLIGPNGAGKTTLLRLIRGELEPVQGRLTIAPAVQAGYLGQDEPDLDRELSPLEAVIKAGETDQGAARQLLGALLFRGDQVYQKIATLSGGEKKRLAFATLLAGGANLLLLDEPTNHLDIESREAVEAALDSFTGTILAVSHDRYFLHRLSDRVLALEHGKLLNYPGSYGEFVESRQRSKSGATDDVLVLENRLAYLSGRLDELARNSSPEALEERERINREFLVISRKLQELR